MTLPRKEAAASGIAAPDMSPRDEAVLLLARGLSTEEAGRKVGVTGRTVRNWRAEPAFAAAVHDARRAVFEEATGVTAGLMKKASLRLGQALDHEDTALRIRAAQILLSAGPSLRQHMQLEEELAALERETGEESR